MDTYPGFRVRAYHPHDHDRDRGRARDRGLNIYIRTPIEKVKLLCVSCVILTVLVVFGGHLLTLSINTKFKM